MLAFVPLDGAVGVASSAVSVLATTVAPLVGRAAPAVAVVLFTVAVRLLITPLTLARVRGERRRAALAPRLAELRRRYADQPERLATEVLAAHREAGVRLLAGFGPTLLQAPFFLVMYRLFTTDRPDSPLGGQLFGVPLGAHLTDGLAGAAGPLFGVLLLALVALAWVSSRRARRSVAAGQQPTAGGDSVPGAAVLTRLVPLLPYAVLPVALVLPLAGVIYLVTTTGWTVLEQVVLNRPAPQLRPA
ncbi:MAG TPA: membrane protein insertase YidC [Micromonospora sp.]